MHRFALTIGGCALLSLSSILCAPAPPLINYQGRVAVGAANFEGTGQFRFALVNADGTQTFWSNDGTSNAGSESITESIRNAFFVPPVPPTPVAIVSRKVHGTYRKTRAVPNANRFYSARLSESIALA